MIDTTELIALAREMAELDNLDMPAALAQAYNQLPALMADVDARYTPRRVVMFDLFSARELWEWTNDDRTDCHWCDGGGCPSCDPAMYRP